MSEIKEAQLPNGDVVQFKDAVAREALTESEIDEICTPIPTEDGLLPIATKDALGCVKIGDGLEIDNAGVLSVGNDYIVEQSTDGTNTYRKWESGILEFWGLLNVSVPVSSWSAWGNIYYSGYIQPGNLNYNYPISFVSGTAIQNLSIAVHNGNAWGVVSQGTSTLTTPPAVYLYSPVKPTAAVSVGISIYTKGRWK